MHKHRMTLEVHQGYSASGTKADTSRQRYGARNPDYTLASSSCQNPWALTSYKFAERTSYAQLLVWKI